MPRFKVRAARAADADRLVRSTLGNALETEGLRLDEATARRGVDLLLRDAGKGRAFLVEATGEPVGSLYVTFEWSDWHAKWYWWVQSLFIDAAWRGKGAYSALWRHVVREAERAHDVRAIRLYVENHNEQALRAYRGHGMHEAPYAVFEHVIEETSSTRAAAHAPTPKETATRTHRRVHNKA